MIYVVGLGPGSREYILPKAVETLTDSKNSPKVLANKLFIENISCNIWVGENLSYEDEKITVGTPEEIMEKEFSSLSVFVVEEV